MKDRQPMNLRAIPEKSYFEMKHHNDVENAVRLIGQAHIKVLLGRRIMCLARDFETAAAYAPKVARPAGQPVFILINGGAAPPLVLNWN